MLATKKKEKTGKLGERKSVRMVELNQWVLMGERNRPKRGGIELEGLINGYDGR